MDNLDRITLIAHFGGLATIMGDDALALIRMLTRDRFNKFKGNTLADLELMLIEARDTAKTEYMRIEKW